MTRYHTIHVNYTLNTNVTSIIDIFYIYLYKTGSLVKSLSIKGYHTNSGK